MTIEFKENNHNMIGSPKYWSPSLHIVEFIGKHDFFMYFMFLIPDIKIIDLVFLEI